MIEQIFEPPLSLDIAEEAGRVASSLGSTRIARVGCCFSSPTGIRSELQAILAMSHGACNPPQSYPEILSRILVFSHRHSIGALKSKTTAPHLGSAPEQASIKRVNDDGSSPGVQSALRNKLASRIQQPPRAPGSVLRECNFVSNVAADHEIGNPWNLHQIHTLIPHEQ